MYTYIGIARATTTPDPRFALVIALRNSDIADPAYTHIYTLNSFSYLYTHTETIAAEEI